MKPKGLFLTWIVVKDFKAAIKFYTEVVGLQVKDLNEEYGWAELTGSDPAGAHLGIAQMSDKEAILPGQNGVFTLTVDNIAKANQEFAKKGGKLIGEMMEVPGHVKLQLCQDKDGNHFQIVEMLG